MIIGSLLHLSDLHIDGRDAGGRLNEGDVTQQRLALLAAFDGEVTIPLPSSLERHVTGFSHEAWGAFEEQLSDVVRDLLGESSDVNVAVVQTGDFSMFGATGSGDSGEAAYPSYGALRALRETVDESLDQAQKRRFQWVDIFGNHDIWPGTIPRRPSWLGGPTGPIQSLPDVCDGNGWTCPTFGIAPLNTVRAAWLRGNILATGEITNWPTSKDWDVGFRQWDDGVRICITHHPLVAVAPLRGLWAGFTWPAVTNWVANGPEAVGDLRSRGCELILAGHLHELWPLQGAGDRLDPKTQPMPQQFLAPSVSKKDGDRGTDECLAFVVYRIYEEDGRRSLSRSVYQFSVDLRSGPSFAPGREQIMLPAWTR